MLFLHSSLKERTPERRRLLGSVFRYSHIIPPLGYVLNITADLPSDMTVDGKDDEVVSTGDMKL